MTNFCTQASIDFWDENKDRGYLIDSPTIENIHGLLKMLDGKTHSLVVLKFPEQYAELTIGGGPENFVSYYTDDNGVFLARPIDQGQTHTAKYVREVKKGISIDQWS